eukprot:7946094-Ditylum_brightwellii.AAC.2
MFVIQKKHYVFLDPDGQLHSKGLSNIRPTGPIRGYVILEGHTVPWQARYFLGVSACQTASFHQMIFKL